MSRLLLVFTSCAAVVSAQSLPSPEEIQSVAAKLAKTIAATREPSPATAGLLRDSRGARFLRDLNLEFKTFENPDGTVALGFGYDFDKAVDLKYFRDGLTTRGFGMHLRAKGSVAFSADTNPRDFLETRLALRWFQNTGGLVRTDAQPTDGTALSAAQRDYFDRFADVGARRARLVEGQAAEMQRLTDQLFAFADALATQTYVDVGLDAGIETDQRFDARNGVFGVRGILDVKAWNDDSALAWANVLDWPFAAIRYLLATDEEFQPRGSAIPTLLVGLDWVEPHGDDPRALAGATDGFLRLQAELGFRTPLGKVGERDLHFACSWRLFHELDADDAIVAADLDVHDWFSATVIADGGLFVSYRTGRLPFDVRDDSAFELGFKLHF